LIDFKSARDSTRINEQELKLELASTIA